jgi:hypothetical protein
MRYDFTVIPDTELPQAVEPTFQHIPPDLRQRSEQDGERVAGGAGQAARVGGGLIEGVPAVVDHRVDAQRTGDRGAPSG